MSAKRIRLIVRGDDFGMCHSVNVAVEKAFSEGILTSASLMVPPPWFHEGVEICKRRPRLSVGIHLTVNGEWKFYRWRPVLPSSEVPSLIDNEGYLFGTTQEFLKAKPRLEEVERELRAQIDLAIKKGVNISHLDHHMHSLVAAPELRQIIEQIANDYGLPVAWDYRKGDSLSIYAIPYRKKLWAMAKILRGIGPGLWVFVCHPGLNTLEMQGLVDANPGGLENVGAHRGAETAALRSRLIRTIIQKRRISLIGYRDVKNELLGVKNG
jgi:predicted glycoside hydrolase/deacetylase ChbG (UPF0249 family)